MSTRINRRSNKFSGSGDSENRRGSRNLNSSKPRNLSSRYDRRNTEWRSPSGENNSLYPEAKRDGYKGNRDRRSVGQKLSSDDSRFSGTSSLKKQNNQFKPRSRKESYSNSYSRNGDFSNNQNSLSQANSYRPKRETTASEFSYGVIQENHDSDLVWGRHATQAVLETGRPVHRIWCTSEMRSSPKFLQLLKDSKASGVLVEEVTWARLGQLTAGAVHQGIALQTAAVDTLDLKNLIKGCAQIGEPPLLVALDGLTDPHNLGAIVRSAEALGAHGMVLPQRRSAGLTGSVAKVAAGALEHLPVARVVNLNRSLEALKKEGYTIIGLADEGDLTISEIDLEGPLVVVTGSEGKGISLVTRRHCDQLVRIPLRGVTTSLNASVATALVLYEVARRGWMKGISGQSPSPKLARAKHSSVFHSQQDESTK